VSPEVVHLTTGRSPEVIHSCGDLSRCSEEGPQTCPLWRRNPLSVPELHCCKLPTLWITPVDNPGPSTGAVVRRDGRRAGGGGSSVMTGGSLLRAPASGTEAEGRWRHQHVRAGARGEGSDGSGRPDKAGRLRPARGQRGSGEPVAEACSGEPVRRWPSGTPRPRSAGPGRGPGRRPGPAVAGGRGESRQARRHTGLP
jgi:hypothetical protein